MIYYSFDKITNIYTFRVFIQPDVLIMINYWLDKINNIYF